MLPKVSIIILNWNGSQDTLECMESLTKISYNNYEIILVDNNSKGNDVNIIEKEYGNYINKIIESGNNLGFSGGNNVGIRYALENNADYIMLLNNDTVVEKDFLNELMKIAISIPTAGIVGPLIGYYNDREKVWSAYGFINKFKSSGFSKKINTKIELVIENKRCTFLSGCCLLIRKEVIEKIGLLDEKYFLYLEDADYCWRTIKAGYRIIFVASSKIYHKVNVSTTRNNSLLPLYYTVRNRLYFAKKSFGNLYFLAYWYIILSMKIKIFIDKQKLKKQDIFIKAISDFKNNIMGQSIIDP
jgi:GT2 family glycosyltransferase